MSALVPAAQSLDPGGTLPTFVASYVTLVQKAQFAGEEPEQRDAHAVQLVMPLIWQLLNVIRSRKAPGAAAAHAGGDDRGESPHAHFASPPTQTMNGRILEGHV